VGCCNAFDVRIELTGGQIKARASGFWDSSNSLAEGGESHAARARVFLHDTIVLSPSSNLTASLSFSVGLRGSIEAISGNAEWGMRAYLAQHFIGSDPRNPRDYRNAIMLLSNDRPQFGAAEPPEGAIYYAGDSWGDRVGSIYRSGPPRRGPAGTVVRPGCADRGVLDHGGQHRRPQHRQGILAVPAATSTAPPTGWVSRSAMPKAIRCTA
jgi:hypothetical protein